MEITKYSNNKKETWDNFIDSSKNGTFMLKRDYMDYHSDRFQDFSLMFYANDELIAVLPASIHDKELRSHGGLSYGGFITTSKMKQIKMLKCFEFLKDYLRVQNIQKVIYKPIPYFYHSVPAQEDLYALAINNAEIIRTDINSVLQLNAKFPLSKGLKAQIARAKKEEVKISQSSDFKTFMEIEEKLLKEKYGVSPVHSFPEILLLHKKFPDNIKLFVAKKNESIIAGTIIFENKDVAHAQYMATTEEGRHLGGLDYLLNELILDIYKHKKYISFGISNDPKLNTLNEGLISKKENFGGRAIIHNTYKWEII